MSAIRSHLIRVSDLPLRLEEEFFPFVFKVENGWLSLSAKWRRINFVVTLAFMEPSTRTRMSFQIAAQRMGLHVNVFESGFSSLSKGESLEDTIKNLDQLQPDIMVVRAPAELELDKLASGPMHSSLVNGGWGALEHPTQAYLDAYTLWKHFGGLSGLKVLIMGDLKYSRVASSHLALLTDLGCVLGVYGPPDLQSPSSGAAGSYQTFEQREDALEWSDVCMTLRVQRERHSSERSPEPDYLENYGLSDRALRCLRPEAVILHPGPVNRGVEISEKAYSDPRSKILEQVNNGLFVRMTLFDVLLNQRLLL